MATWQAARDQLLVREKAHTREGDAIAAARRRLPMVEVDGTVEVAGADGPVPFVDLFQGRDELVVYQHMWYDGAPPQGQCEGCTTTANTGKTDTEKGPTMAELLIDFITTLDSCASGDGWARLLGPRRTGVPRVAGRGSREGRHGPDGGEHVSPDVAVLRGGRS
jgi:hypothetical protein